MIDGNDLERVLAGYRTLLAGANWIPMDELVAADQASPYYNEANKVSIFYAQSWALTHLLMMGDGTGPLKKELADYLTLLEDFVPSAVAYRRTIGRGGTHLSPRCTAAHPNAWTKPRPWPIWLRGSPPPSRNTISSWQKFVCSRKSKPTRSAPPRAP